MKKSVLAALPALILCLAPRPLPAQPIAVPSWTRPASPGYKQVPPPPDFRRPSKNFAVPIGLFDGQSDVGSALVPGSASYDAGTGQYTINSAGYNIFYTHDEFRYLWKKISGDVSLAASITFPDPNGFGDRKVVFIIRQDLDDDAQEVMTALHGHGLIHLAQRPVKGGSVKATYRLLSGPLPTEASPGNSAGVVAKRVGIEKRGDAFALFVSLNGEPMHALGDPLLLHFDEPFYAGVGFCSHLPVTVDTAVLAHVVFENIAGDVH